MLPLLQWQASLENVTMCVRISRKPFPISQLAPFANLPHFPPEYHYCILSTGHGPLWKNVVRVFRAASWTQRQWLVQLNIVTSLVYVTPFVLLCSR